MLVSSIFYFSHNVFYSSQNKICYVSHIYFAVSKVFSNWTGLKFLLFGKELNKSSFANASHFNKSYIQSSGKEIV